MARKSTGRGPVDFDPKNLGRGRPVSTFVIENKAKSKGDWCRIVNKKDEDKTLVYIYDEIGMWGTTASDFTAQLKEIESSEIELHLNSPGGEVWDGIAIYNSLKQHDAKVTVIVDSLAASAASFIAQAGDKVIMARNATMMIHDASGLAWGNAETMRETADILDGISDNIADIYAQRAGEDIKFWRDIMKKEQWYTGKEAVAYGLADEVTDSDEPDDGKTTDDEVDDRFDLSVFNYAGRSKSPSPATVMAEVKNKTEENSVTKPEDKAPVTGPTQTPITMSINGVMESDPAKIQAHITSLETAQSEQKSSARAAFIDKLAEDNKIGQPQVDGFKDLVASLSDEQYEKWTKPWDTAASLPVLGQHGRASGDGGQGNTTNAVDEEIKLYEDIVNHNRRGGMKQEALEKTPSYLKLQNLLAQKKN